jgi:hypothetical protein
MPAVPIPAAAADLAVSVPTLRRWLRAGAPLARRGARGRGRAALVDPQAVAAWRASQCVTLAAAAAGLPDLIAGALADAFDQTEGLPKSRMAGFVAGAWYLAATRCMDHLRQHDEAVPDVTEPLPLAVARLLKIASQ